MKKQQVVSFRLMQEGHKVHQIVNPVLLSNTFIIEISPDEVVVVDPGNPDVSEVVNWLQQNNMEIAAVLLTHEHADHSSGINQLYEFQPFELICTRSCFAGIQNSKQNLSFYHSDLEAFEVDLPATVMREGGVISIGYYDFRFIETPGHSPGSSCIFFDNAVLTGDTLLNNVKTTLRFPHSDRKLYGDSLEKLHKTLNHGVKVYPGHGEPFIVEKL